MERNVRRRFDSKFKTKVAIEAIKGDKTIAQISSEYRVHSSQITKWKQQAIEGLPKVFQGEKKVIEDKLNESKFYEEIGRLKFELDFLKKKSEYIF